MSQTPSPETFASFLSYDGVVLSRRARGGGQGVPAVHGGGIPGPGGSERARDPAREPGLTGAAAEAAGRG